MAGLGVHHQFQHIEQFAGIPSAITHQSLALPYLYGLVLKQHIFMDSPVQKRLQIALFQRLKNKDLATGEKGSDDLEGRILRSGSYQNYGSVLHSTQESILLGFVEAVNFVDEKDGSPFLVEEGIAPSLVKHFPHILHPGHHGTQGVEIPIQGFRNDMGQGGFPHARRPPENEGTEVPALYHLPQNAAFAHQMPLAHILVQGAGTHPLRERGQHDGRSRHLDFFGKDPAATF